MRQSARRAIVSALVTAPILLLGPDARAPQAGLLAPRPGPIDRPLALGVADFDRDGLQDIVVADYQTSVLNLLVGRADGTFVPHPLGPIGVGLGAVTIGNPTSGPFQLIVLDLNPEDVDQDTVPNATDNCPNFSNPPDTSGVQLDANHNNIGDACEFGTDTTTPPDGIIDVTVDTDGDGILDFDPVNLTLDNCPNRPNPLQEDTDDDGIGDACPGSPDILILGQSAGAGSVLGVLRVRMNTGGGGFSSSRPSYSTSIGPGAIAAGDFNRDGHTDVALTNTTFKAIQVFPGLGDGRLTAPSIFDTGAGPQGIVWGDWDGDLDLDLAVANRTDKSLSLYMNTGGVLTAVTLNPPTAVDAPSVLLAGNLNGDPFNDLVVLGQGAPGVGEKVQVFLGSAPGVLVPQTAINIGAGHVPRSGILADLDGNGTLDLALADFDGRSAMVLGGVGDGTFAAPTVVPLRGQATDIATIDLPPAGGPPDLAVLQFQGRVDLLQKGVGLNYGFASTTPASPWKETTAMAFTGIDLPSVGDLVLLQDASGVFDVLSGIGDNSFRPLGRQKLEGLTATLPAHAEFMQVADVAFNNRPDLAIVDPVAGKLVLVTNELTATLSEGDPISIPAGASGIGSGNLIASITDYDRDGVPNVLDDCPTVYNPPGCTVTDPLCPRTLLCTLASVAPTNCMPGDPGTTDPLTHQCDSDRNGIGDHCQALGAPNAGSCANIDPDFDQIPQYDVNALKKSTGGLNDFDADGVPNAIDNCPTIANANQTDTNNLGVGDACRLLDGNQGVDPDNDEILTWDPVSNEVDNCPDVFNPDQEDNDNDTVGNACIIAKALDNCPQTLNNDQGDTDGDGVGNACAAPPPDLLIPNPVANNVTLLAGDGSGFLHPAAASPLAVVGATAAVTGQFSMNCLGLACFSSDESDIAVASRGAASGSADDGVFVFIGDDQGGYTPANPPAAPAAGDPDALLVLFAQPTCPIPNDPVVPNLRHDIDGTSDILIVTERGASDLRVLLGSNMNAIDPLRSPLVRPTGHPAPLPTPPDLRSVVSLDLNRDDLDDLIVVAAPPGGPTTIKLFMGLGNGLFYTDASLDPDVLVGDELDLPVTGFIDLKSDSLYPDIALFSRLDQAPITLFNILPERADIDRSGRVDGFDLVALARAFGATRGEDFILNSDATFQRTGSGWSERLVASGSRPPGQALPSASDCGNTPVLMTGAYGLPVDINLDGIVDGVDLALLASRFADTIP